MATIAGSAIDVDVLETKNTASSSRPSSRLANTGNTSDTNNNNTNSTTHQTSTPTTHQRTNSSNLLDANENKEENKNSSEESAKTSTKTFFFRCQKCKTPLEFEKVIGDDDRDHAKFIAETSGKLKVTVGEKQFRDFLEENCDPGAELARGEFDFSVESSSDDDEELELTGGHVN